MTLSNALSIMTEHEEMLALLFSENYREAYRYAIECMEHIDAARAIAGGIDESDLYRGYDRDELVRYIEDLTTEVRF